jgi:hypothetical protein
VHGGTLRLDGRCSNMDDRREKRTILADISRLKHRYDGAVERGLIDAARQARAGLSGMLAELGRDDPDLEAQLRRDMKFPETMPWY